MAIFGLAPRAPLPEGWTPLEATAVLKCLDEEGDVVYYIATTEGLLLVEQLGMLTAAAATTTEDLNRAFRSVDDE